MRNRRSLEPRYVSADSIRPGDVIRVTWKEHDVTLSVVGKLGSVRRTDTGTYFVSEKGFGMFFRDPTGYPIALMGLEPTAHVRITLLESGHVPTRTELDMPDV